MDSIERRLQLALEIARQAGDLTLQYFRQSGLQVDSKADATPVTAADRGAEQLLRERIAEAFPADAILGEEFPVRDGTSGYRWILDPIDGTKSFIHGVPLYGTLIGVEHEGDSRIGVIRIPAMDEMVYAAAGQGAWHVIGHAAPQPARVSTLGPLNQSLFLTSSVASFGKAGRHDVFDRMLASCRLTRTWGDCYGYMMVATGRAEVMIDPIVSLWDVAALKPIIEEAGGRLTDWQARPTIHSGQCIATNGLLHDEVMAIVRG